MDRNPYCPRSGTPHQDMDIYIYIMCIISMVLFYNSLDCTHEISNLFATIISDLEHCVLRIMVVWQLNQKL